MNTNRRVGSLFAAALALGALAIHFSRAAEPAKPHAHRLPSVSIKQQVIWGSICEAPDGTALSFGGEDRDADDGLSHTRLRVNGEWIELRDELVKASPMESARTKIWAVRDAQKGLLSRARGFYFQGDAKGTRIGFRVLEAVRSYMDDVIRQISSVENQIDAAAQTNMDVAAAWKRVGHLAPATEKAKALRKLLDGEITPQALSGLREMQVLLESAADEFAAEPPARALSPIVYDAQSKLFILFGGDHCDYLTADTWAFDPATRKWSQRHPKTAPPPRANHAWKSAGEGKLILTGGYTYSSNTDYMGGQYIDLPDGEWTYDIAADSWTGGENRAAAFAPQSRAYRSGPFVPEYFFNDVPRPDAAEFQATLKALPANVWTKTHPPKLPKLNRDWGSAVIDSDRDLILRWSGGHCAHGGSDVLEYHMATNRWELCYPVEFPLGQLYDNTEYPGGFNFNRRPWISGHTYQNYGVDPILKKMIFLGHSPWGYVYDPAEGEWSGRHALPRGMHYSGSMYTLTTTATPQGLICWTDPDAKVYRFEAAANEWKALATTGEKLPGSSVDNSMVVYDSRRDRLLFFRKEYGDKKKYDGEIYALDMKSLTVSHLLPAGKAAAAEIPYLCQIRYDAEHDMLLVGATLPPGADGIRRTPAYDCASNAWKSLKITGEDPSGKKGRDVSLGMMYDAQRRLFWAVDASSEIYVLRLDPAAGDLKDLGQ